METQRHGLGGVGAMETGRRVPLMATPQLPRERVVRSAAPVSRNPRRLRASWLGFPGRPCSLLGPRFPWRVFATHLQTIKAVRPYRTPFEREELTPEPRVGCAGGDGPGVLRPNRMVVPMR